MSNNKISNIIELTNDNFSTYVEKSQDICLVNFWAEWAAPCRYVLPALESLANEMIYKIKVYNVDVDRYMAIADKYNITGIPTLLFFKNGQVSKKFVGVTSKEDLKNYILSLEDEKVIIDDIKDYDFSNLDLG
jgi:thioredoxin 1